MVCPPISDCGDRSQFERDAALPEADSAAGLPVHGQVLGEVLGEFLREILGQILGEILGQVQVLGR